MKITLLLLFLAIPVFAQTFGEMTGIVLVLATFGKITSARTMRELQFGVKYNF